MVTKLIGLYCLRRFYRQSIFFSNIREPSFYILPANDIHRVFNRYFFTVRYKELAKELKTFTLSTIGTFLLKMSCSTYCQMGTWRESNYHVPLSHHFVIGSILCMELTVTVQQR